MREIWKPVLSFDGFFSDRYDVSTRGRVRSIVNNTFRKTPVGAQGYPVLTLCKNGVTRVSSVHALVAEAFICLRPSGYQVNHKDGDKANNNVDNLEYITPRENVLHAHKHGLIRKRGVDNPFAILTEAQVVEIRERYAQSRCGLAALATEYKVSRAAIYYIVRRMNWRHIPQEHPVPDTSYKCKLSMADVQSAKTRYRSGTHTQKELAREYGVSGPYVSMVIAGHRRCA